MCKKYYQIYQNKINVLLNQIIFIKIYCQKKYAMKMFTECIRIKDKKTI